MQIVHSKKKQFYDKATRPTKRKPKNNKPTIFLKRNISRLKNKTGHGQFRTQNLCSTRRICFLLAKWAGNAKNLKLAGNTQKVTLEMSPEVHY